MQDWPMAGARSKTYPQLAAILAFAARSVKYDINVGVGADIPLVAVLPLAVATCRIEHRRIAEVERLIYDVLGVRVWEITRKGCDETKLAEAQETFSVKLPLQTGKVNMQIALQLLHFISPLSALFKRKTSQKEFSLTQENTAIHDETSSHEFH